MGAFTASADELTSSLYLSPYSGTFFVSNTFDVSVFVNTEGNVINAVEIDLKFPPDLLQVTSPTAGSSFISVWADQPSYSNKDGIINFKGGVPKPGIKTSAGLVSTITFRAKAPGIAKISFSDSSKILLADGKGTNILKTTALGEYVLVLQSSEGPKISSPTHPSLTTWYRDNNPTFFIEEETGITGFSYALDQDPLGIPDNVSNDNDNSASFNDIENGIWYFHAKVRKNGVWSGVSHYPIRIDNIPPKNFEIRFESISLVMGSKFFAYFSTEDTLSGIDYYEISLVDMEDPQSSVNPFFLEAVSPYRIPQENSGQFAIFIKAYDKAGNFVQEKTTLLSINSFLSFTKNGIMIKNFLLPVWLVILITVLILGTIVLILFRYLKRRNLAARLKTEVAEAEKEIEDVKKLEKKIQNMRKLEEEAQKESERLANHLRKKDV
ncbi:cohesin domain-containing protein [Patescibacteria group bacterium]